MGKSIDIRGYLIPHRQGGAVALYFEGHPRPWVPIFSSVETLRRSGLAYDEVFMIVHPGEFITTCRMRQVRIAADYHRGEDQRCYFTEIKPEYN